MHIKNCIIFTFCIKKKLFSLTANIWVIVKQFHKERVLNINSVREMFLCKTRNVLFKDLIQYCPSPAHSEYSFLIFSVFLSTLLNQNLTERPV